MGSTSQKLTYLSGTKDRLKTTINYAGGTLTNETFRQYPEKLYDKYLDILKDNGEELFASLPKATGTGTSITLNNTANTRMKMNLAPSELEQATTTGKNLAQLTLSEEGTAGGITYKPNEDGSITITGTRTSGTTKKAFSVYLEPSTRYYFNCFDRNTGEKYENSQLQGVVSDFIVTINDNFRTTSSFVAGTYDLALKGSTNGASFNGTYFFSLAKEDLTTYEPYTGGIPAPNPEFPTDIHTISGDNEIVVKNSDNTQEQTLPLTLGTLEYCKIGDYADEFMIPSGKNLFDKDNANYVAGLSFNASDMKYSSAGSSGRVYYIPCLPYTTYTYSKSLGTFMRVGSSPNIPAVNGTISVINSTTTGTSATITTGAHDNYIAFYPLLSSEISTIGFDNVLATVQIEKGSQATTYEPYNNGKWYLKKNIGKVVLDGSESDWNNGGVDGNTTYRTYLTKSDVALNTNDEIKAISNYFKGNTPSNIIDNLINGISTRRGTGHGLYIRVPIAIASTIAEFKTWLSTHNTTVYYVLDASSYILLNDTLQEQLTNIYNKALSYQDQTNISQVNDDLPFVISANAIKKYELN